MMAGDLEYKIEIDNSDFRQGLTQSKQELAGISQDIGGQSAPAMRASTAVKALAGSYLALAAARKAVSLANEGLGIANSVEAETVRLKVLLGSMQESEALMNRVLQKAGETPLQTAQLQQATRMLVAFGSNSKDVIDELTRLGDISSGVGMEITALAEIYGKARIQGTLFAEDINQLTGRGIPVISQFADILGVTEGEVKKLASQGKVGFAELEEAIRRLTDEGGQFNGMMEEMSQTGEGALSTLHDNFDQLVLIPMGNWVKSWLDPMVDGLNEAAAKVKRIQDLDQNYNAAKSNMGSIRERAGSVTSEKEKQDLIREAEQAAIEARDRALKIAEDERRNGGFGGSGEMSKEAEQAIDVYYSLADTYRAVAKEISKISDEQLASQKKKADQEAEYRASAAKRKAYEATEEARKAAEQAITEDASSREKENVFNNAINNRDADPILERIEEAKKQYELLLSQTESSDADLLDSLPGQIASVRDEIERLEDGLLKINQLKLKDQEALDRKEEKDALSENERVSRVSSPEPEVDRFARLGLFLGGGRDVTADNRRQKTEQLMEKMGAYLDKIERNTSKPMPGSWS